MEIPINMLDEGLRLCSQNIRRFRHDVERLVQDGSDWHATALLILALEELAKYSESKRAKQTAAKGTIVTVDDRLFAGRESHKHKLSIAKGLVPVDSLTLLSANDIEGLLPKGISKGKDTVVSEMSRLESLFVDWKKGQSVHGTPVLPYRLKKLSEEILNAMNILETTI